MSVHIRTVYPVYLSFTTIPERLDRAKKLAEDILKNLTGFEKLIINIPTSYKKFPFFSKKTSELGFPDHPKLIINRCLDYGPITKLVPTLQLYEIQHQECILIIFDDNEYHLESFKIIAEKQELNPSKSFSYYTYPYKKLSNVAQGVDIISFWNPNLTSFLRFFQERILNRNRYCFYVDDLVISYYLSENGIKVEELPRKWKWAWIPDIHENKWFRYSLFKKGGIYNRDNSMKQCYQHLNK